MIFFWFLLFPLNRVMGEMFQDVAVKGGLGSSVLFEEQKVAAFIFAATLFWFMHFACGTIGQITRCLDISCFTIKR